MEPKPDYGWRLRNVMTHEHKQQNYYYPQTLNQLLAQNMEHTGMARNSFDKNGSEQRKIGLIKKFFEQKN